jgi:hypothetical protein
LFDGLYLNFHTQAFQFSQRLLPDEKTYPPQSAAGSAVIEKTCSHFLPARERPAKLIRR